MSHPVDHLEVWSQRATESDISIQKLGTLREFRHLYGVLVALLGGVTLSRLAALPWMKPDWASVAALLQPLDAQALFRLAGSEDEATLLGLAEIGAAGGSWPVAYEMVPDIPDATNALTQLGCLWSRPWRNSFQQVGCHQHGRLQQCVEDALETAQAKGLPLPSPRVERVVQMLSLVAQGTLLYLAPVPPAS